MKNILLPLLILSACGGVKETIIDSQTGEKMIGFGADCKYQIGKTRRSEFTQAELDALGKDSLWLVFMYASSFQTGDTLIGGLGVGKYGPSKGLKAGDSVEKALKLYGKPVATDLEYWWDKQNRFKNSYEGLFYKDMAILIDTSTNTVRPGSLWVGKIFPVDKWYCRKNYWLKK